MRISLLTDDDKIPLNQRLSLSSDDCQWPALKFKPEQFLAQTKSERKSRRWPLAECASERKQDSLTKNNIFDPALM